MTSRSAPKQTLQTATACPECDLLVDGTTNSGHCSRCGARLYRQGRHSLDNTLALACSALVLLIAANAFPIVGLDIQGQRIETTVIGAAVSLWREEMGMVAILVLLSTTVLPLIELAGLVWMALPLRLGKRPPGFSWVFRVLHMAHPWAMIEVFIMGLLVALVKLTNVADVFAGAAAWCFGCVMLLLAILHTIVEPRDLWQAWEEAEQ
ncbi:paraquat-inducible protein A [Shewanella profunda]|jgi:paraquat-inducible protein A|uniref:paraquat-inducible protein A n=1 Tax=Shewanella profunda TaxID=254793 RepID=UPI00200FFEF0|nr:paraquat-inducible protein A [Shewanella profunda]MCL1089107.1 paraquat-inducible protein A [Shewanella profunda]